MNRRCRLLCCLLWLSAAAAARADGDWVLLTGINGYWTNNVDLPVCRKLAELQGDRVEFKCVAFAPAGGSAILFGARGYWAERIPQEALERLAEVARSGGTLKWLAFTPGGGWCLFFNENGYHARNIPEDALQKIREVAGQGRTLKSITFLAGGCALLWDQNGHWCRGVPEEAMQKVTEVARDGGKLKMLAATPGGGWSLFWNRGAHWNRGIPSDAFRRLGEASGGGSALVMIAYVPVLDVSLADAAASYVLEARSVPRVRATLTTDITLPGAKVDEWYIYAPRPPNLPCQRDVQASFAPAGQVTREKSPLGRPVFLTRITDGRNTVHTLLSIEATPVARRLRLLPPGQSLPPVKDLARGEVATYTAVTIACDTRTRAFRDWLRENHLRRAPGERDLLFAHRVFAFIKHHLKYQWPTEHHTASQVCAAGVSDCGGLSALFTGTMRCHGVPARLLGGRWASSQTGSDRKVHVKAEFFARGIGWIPVDAASAVGNTNGENTFFGNDSGDFLAFMDDEDILLDSFVAGPKNLGVLQGLAWWWRGSGEGKQSRFEDSWLVQPK